MIKVTTQAAQGDVLFRRISVLPENAQKAKSANPIVVAHSETGHDHVIQDPRVVMYEEPGNPLVCYLRAAEPFEVTHLRSFDTHEALLLDSGPGVIWEVRKQREHTPEGWRRVED
jgi:hypothetical protein